VVEEPHKLVLMEVVTQIMVRVELEVLHVSQDLLQEELEVAEVDLE
jgi:hypothetical protein